MTANTNTILPMSLYIPHVFPNITEKRIVNIFHTLLLGKVSRVDFIPKTDVKGKPFNAAYVHFDYWYNNTAAHNFQVKVLDPQQEARLVYDDPWYWVVLENKANNQLEDEDEEQLEDGEQLEDEEMEQILDQMDACEDSRYYTEYKAIDYAAEKALECEKLQKTVEKMRWQIKDLEESRMEARKNARFFEDLKEEYYIQCRQNKDDLTLYQYENDHYRQQNSELLQERMELTAELAHFKELLAQYEPDVKKQNKNLYH